MANVWTLEGSGEILLHLYSDKLTPSGTKYVDYLINGLSRQTECTNQCPNEIINMVVDYAFTRTMKSKDEMASDLFDACTKGDIKVAHQILTLPSFARDSNAQTTALMTACEHGFIEVVNELLQMNQIDINQQQKTDGATALFIVCREGAVECVRKLLGNDLIRVNLCDKNGRSPLFIASLFGHNRIVEMLITHSFKMRAKSMVHGQLNVNLAAFQGITPLLIAAQKGHTKIVTMLLDNGANVNHTDERGRTPLQISALRGHVKVVRVLLSHLNIEIDHRDCDKETALWAACMYKYNNYKVIELLLNPPHGNGANPNLAENDGCTPLWIAASRGDTKCVEILIKYGADLNIADNSGVTPLFVAVQNGKTQIVNMLIAANADANISRNEDSVTPLMMAVQNDYIEIVELLLRSGANAALSNKDAVNALEYAATAGRLDILKMLFKQVAKVVDSQALISFINTQNAVNWVGMEGKGTDVFKFLVEEIKVDLNRKE